MAYKYQICRMLENGKSKILEGAYEKWTINIKFVVCSRAVKARY